MIIIWNAELELSSAAPTEDLDMREVVNIKQNLPPPFLSERSMSQR